MSSPEADFYRRHVSGSEVKETPSLEEFAKWADNLFKPTGTYWLVPQVMKDQKVERLVEIGCGGGEALAWMAKYAKEAIGTDLVLPLHLKKSSASHVRYLEMNANQTFPFETASVNVVIAVSVIEHIFDPFHFCAELNRILAKNGLAFIHLPLVTNLKNRWNILRGRIPMTSSADWFERRQWDSGHLHYFSMEMTERLFHVSGFEKVSHACDGRLPQLKRMFPSLLAGNIMYAFRKTN